MTQKDDGIHITFILGCIADVRRYASEFTSVEEAWLT